MQRSHQQPETKIDSSTQQTKIKTVGKNLSKAGTSKEPIKESPLSKEILGLGASKGLAVWPKTNACHLCGSIYSRSDSLMAHIKQKHLNEDLSVEPKTNACHLCGLIYSRSDRLKAHIKQKHLNEDLSVEPKTNACHLCGSIYSRSDSLKAHIKRKHLNEDLKPNIKTETLKAEKEMTTEDPTFCKICSKKFSRKAELKDHVKRKHDIQQFHQNETKDDAEPPTQAKRKSTTDLEETPKKKIKTNVPVQKSAGLSEYYYRSGGVYHCRLCDKSYSCGSHVTRHAKSTHFKNGKQLEKQVADPEKATATERRKVSPKSLKSLNLVSQSVKKARQGIQRIDKTSAIAAQNLGKQTAVSENSVSQDRPNQSEQKNGSDIKIKCPSCFKFASSMKELISHMRTEH